MDVSYFPTCFSYLFNKALPASDVPSLDLEKDVVETKTRSKPYGSMILTNLIDDLILRCEDVLGQ
jgi:hypothetical protein